MHILHLASVVQWLGLIGLYFSCLTLFCLHTYQLLLVNSATLCIRQVFISLQLCHLFMLISLTKLQPCCLKGKTWSSRMALRKSGLRAVCRLHFEASTGHWQAIQHLYSFGPDAWPPCACIACHLLNLLRSMWSSNTLCTNKGGELRMQLTTRIKQAYTSNLFPSTGD